VILAFLFVDLFRITAVVTVIAVVVVIMVVVGIVASLVMRVFMFAMMFSAPSVTARETLSGTKAQHSRHDGTGQDI